MEYNFEFRSLSQQEANQVQFPQEFHRYIDEMGEEGVDYAKLLGNIMTLFGQPLHKDPGRGLLYGYLIEAKNQEGNILYLDLHFASGGPTVFCDNNTEALQAVEELVKLIVDASPTDYEYNFLGDELSKVKSGVKNGKPYWKEKSMLLF